MNPPSISALKELEKAALRLFPRIWHRNMATDAIKKEWFMAGYDEILRRIEPEKIICYKTLFPKMRGDIVFVDYECSSWRYMNYGRSYKTDNSDMFKIGGQPTTLYDKITPFVDVPLKGAAVLMAGNGGQIPPNQRINGMWERRERSKLRLCQMGIFIKQKLAQMERMLWNGTIQFIIDQISIPIRTTMKYVECLRWSP